MDQIYDKEGLCLRCKGTEVCHSCGGSGKNPERKEADCPTCDGGGKCVFCRGKKVIHQEEKAIA